jgi:serine/threonine protein kinase
MAISVDQFVQQLLQSSLMSAAEVAALIDSLPANEKPQDGEQLALELVHQEKLTAYQAQQIYAGKGNSLVLGNCVILDKLGQGGMGVVFKARHRSMDRLVAIKTIRPGAMRSHDAVQRFYREVKAAARLSHPNIVTAHDAGEHEGMHYLVMEYVEGKDLARLLAEHGPLPVAQTLQCMIQAARGLEYAHQQGIVHRDIKPGNLLVHRSGTVKVSDMGLARTVSTDAVGDAVRDERLTGTAEVMGTFHFMAPEQAINTHQVDGRADIYALGCTLYCLVTGKLPYTGQTPIETMLAHREWPIPSLRASRPDVSPLLDDICHKMLAKRPEDRYQSMGEVVDAFAGYLAAVEQPTEMPDEDVEAVGSISSWLERLSHAGAAAAPVIAPPKAPAPPIAGEETRVYRAEHDTRPHTHKPPAVHRRSSRKYYPLIIALSAAVGVLLLVVILALSIGRLREPPEQSAERQKSGVSSQPETSLPQQSTKVDQKGPPPPLVALDQADAKAKALAAEQRYGEAVQQYKSVPSLGEDAALRQRVDKSVAQLEQQAARAYNQVEARARQLLADKKYADARSALQPVLDRYGIARHAEAAKKLLVEIESAEKKAELLAKTPAAKPSVTPAAPAPPPKPAPSPEELAAQKELERQRQLETRYAEATKPIEALAASWDFRGAAVELNNIRFAEEELTARLAQRRSELKRMHDLKQKIIAAVNKASPPLKKSDLGIKGIGGDVTKADDGGFTTAQPRGKTETVPWSAIGASGLAKLFAPKQFDQLLTSPEADDWLAAGLVALAVGSGSEAERCLERARSLGMNIEPYLATLAAAAFAEANSLLDKKQFSAAETVLAAVEQKYASTPWFTSHKPALAAARSVAKTGIHETEAEQLYAEAVELFAQKEFFDLKPLVDRLKNEYPQTAPMTDGERKPPFAEMERVAAHLGKRLTVRKDGKGDFTTIQAAIDAAPDNSLIEIVDRGPFTEYNEKIGIGKAGITLRGKTGAWPIITSVGRVTSFSKLVVASARGTTIERLVLAHGGSAGADPQVLNGDFRARSTILYGSSLAGSLDLASCALITQVAPGSSLAARDCLWLQGRPHTLNSYRFTNLVLYSFSQYVGPGPQSQFRCCTICGPVKADSQGIRLIDCIVPSVQSSQSDTEIKYCNVYGDKPYIDLAKPDATCFREAPVFMDPKNFDYRLRIPLRGKASDGGQVGCRYTPEMLEILKVALELRRRGIVKF